MKTVFTKRSVLLILFVLSAFMGMAQTTFTVGDLNYRVNDDGISVTVTGHANGTNATGELILPESVNYGGNTYSVTVIGENAFYACSGLTGDLIIPNTVVSIEAGAFYYCYGFMGTLTIGNSVETIGDIAFGYCTYMTGGLTLPNSLISVGDGAFAYCYGFTGDLIIPNSVTHIGESAFQICYGFDGALVIGNSVTYIGDYAFNSCDGLKGIATIPSCVESIGGNTLGYCAFDGIVVDSDNGIYDSREDCNAIIVTSTNELITGCKSTIIPNTVTAIGDNAFKGITGMTSIHIPHSVTSIGENAFAFCYDLTGDLVIPDDVTTIGSGAFFNCENFKGTLVIGASVSFIGDYAFRNCSGFTGAVSNAETPPVLGNEWGGMVFDGFWVSSLVVPCGCSMAYQNSDWYDPYGMYGFYEFIEDCSVVSEDGVMVSVVYPNPFISEVHISAAEAVNGNANISVYNILGEQVISKAMQCNGTTEFVIDGSSLMSGIYFYSISTENGMMQGRIVKE